jgi:hypothetical protein
VPAAAFVITAPAGVPQAQELLLPVDIQPPLPISKSSKYGKAALVPIAKGPTQIEVSPLPQISLT